ncbi:NUDIX hydrolase [Methylobacterium oxalidis]|uniref:NUDIX hydrolase n=1 Tax=Methylobacterium oxalidis TaxID=944322 RepID=UPI0033153E2B
MAPIIRGTRTVHDGWSRFLVAEVTMPDGTPIKREIEDHGRAVGVLPYDPERRVAVLISQFRAAPFYADGVPDLLEAPAGLLDEGEPEDGARREVFEETGIALGSLERVVRAWSMPGISTEQMDLFLAAFTAADRTGPGGGLASEHEAITVHEVPLADLAAMSDRGELNDMKTLVLVQTLRLRRPELFGAG